MQIIVHNAHRYKMENKLDINVDVEINSISNPQSFDQFKINIINLNDDKIWENKGSATNKVDTSNDFHSLGEILINSKNAKNIILLPQNKTFKYGYVPSSKKHSKFVPLKDMLDHLTGDILQPITSYYYNLIFENTTTNINGMNIKSSFYFYNESSKSVTQSIGSSKTTTIKLNENVYVSTLELDDLDNLKEFIQFLGLVDEKEIIPEWVHNISFLDDDRLEQNIKDNKENIIELENEIQLSENKLAQNLRYKSILYTNGNELVDVVFEILELLFDTDLESFIDEKNEDFIVNFESLTFIGEIKGVTSNVRSEHISQLDVHYQNYLDKLQEEDSDKKEFVKSILIINHQRNKNIDLREPIHENQIALAHRNESLIIESSTLLDIFEKFKNQEISTDEIKEIFQSQSGLLKM